MTNACRSLDPVLLQGRRCQYSADYACAIVLVISCNLVVFFVAFVIFSRYSLVSMLSRDHSCYVDVDVNVVPIRHVQEV